jgi:hypothetical protein
MLRAMRLVIREIHASRSADALNDEWFVLENPGDRAFSTAGCSVLVGKGQGRLRAVGTLDPGFTIQPQERVRVITGNPGKKAHGPVPEAEGARNYHLFQASRLLGGAGSVVALALRQQEVARATFDPGADAGVAAAGA